jgi:hypothetical protein
MDTNYTGINYASMGPHLTEVSKFGRFRDMVRGRYKRSTRVSNLSFNRVFMSILSGHLGVDLT